MTPYPDNSGHSLIKNKQPISSVNSKKPQVVKKKNSLKSKQKK